MVVVAVLDERDFWRGREEREKGREGGGPGRNIVPKIDAWMVVPRTQCWV